MAYRIPLDKTNTQANSSFLVPYFKAKSIKLMTWIDFKFLNSIISRKEALDFLDSKGYVLENESVEQNLIQYEKTFIQEVIRLTSFSIGEFFRNFYDFHNFKIFEKKQMAQKEIDIEIFSEFGCIDRLELMDRYFTQNNIFPHRFIRTSIYNDIHREFNSQTNGFQIDVYWDKFYIEFVQNFIQDIENTHLKQIYRIWFDIKNILSFLRMKQLNQKFELFSEVFIHHPSILDLKWFEYKFYAPINSDMFHGVDFYTAMKEGLQTFEQTSSVSQLEILLYRYLYFKMKYYLSFSNGVECSIFYFFLKKLEIDSLRLYFLSRKYEDSQDWFLKNLRVSA